LEQQFETRLSLTSLMTDQQKQLNWNC